MHISVVRRMGAAIILAAIIGSGCVSFVPAASAQVTTFTFTSKLSVGSVGPEVTALQQILVQQGLLSVSPTGYFGSLTKQALEVLQATYGLQPVGFTGPRTRTLLNSLYSGSSAQTTPPPSTQTASSSPQTATTTTSSTGTLQLTADHLSVAAGTPVTLTWSSSSSLSNCSASGAWSGSLSANGSALEQPSQNSTYTITCTDGHTSYTQSVSVTVTASAPVPVSTTTSPTQPTQPTQSTTTQPTPVPTPTPTPTPVSSTDNPLVGLAAGVGAADIPTTDHNVNNDLTTMAVPASAYPDVVGAFRFVCRHTNLAYDDPTVYPNQPGKSHLHDQTGVNGWNAYSNYGNLRTGGGGSGCNDVAGSDGINQPVSNVPAAETNWSANRTPYWQPALLDGKGNVIVADLIVVYYKRRPLTDPVISDPTNAQYEGKGVKLPNGLKFIFGAFPGDSSKAPDTRIMFQCTGSVTNATYEGGDPANPITFAEAISCAKAHSDGRVNIRLEAPSCWDGVNLDSADHRSHLANPSYGSWGYQKCDAAHPYVIPSYTYNAFYTILPTDTGDIHFSSDEMDNTKPRGWSFHVDYGPAAWDPTVLNMWENGCIDKLLNCSSGNLGNGFGLKGAAQPIYNINGIYSYSWTNPVRLVPIPTRPVAAAMGPGSMLAQVSGAMKDMNGMNMGHGRALTLSTKASQGNVVAHATVPTVAQPQAYAAAAEALPAQPAGSFLSRFIHALFGWLGF